MKSHENTRFAIRKILAAGVLPVVLGGDHSVHAPVIEAYEGRGPIHIVHIDAHLDFVDERHGVRYSGMGIRCGARPKPARLSA